MARARTGRAAGQAMSHRPTAAAQSHARKPWKTIGCFVVSSGSPILCHVVIFRVYPEDDFLPQTVHELQVVEVLRLFRQLQLMLRNGQIYPFHAQRVN